ncbi:MAG: hybrid sensor histidine kinase/response regulator [Xenococcaceae cyanobacterium MO_188.B19]|nr:hybrid sensor histidine kinase/response regulator [Xenococcaceae cyanobacterium MO_188.B19]
MIDREIREQTYQFFLEEAPELLQILETNLLNLRESRDSGILHEIMRAAHSIKGGAATVGLEVIKEIAHRLESIFRALFSDTVELDTELESLLLQAYDCLREPLQQQIAEGHFDEELALINADAIYTKIEAILGDALKEGDLYIPSSNDMGVDMVASIFEVDVTESIERLAMVMANPQSYQVETELKTQTEIFAGFAEILDLPGFREITQTVLEKLNSYPDQALQILPLAIADFQSAKEAVMGGDRAQGGTVSDALRRFGQGTEAQPVNNAAAIAESLEVAPLESLELATAESLELVTPETPSSLGDIGHTLDDLELLLSETEPTETLEVPLDAVVAIPESETEPVKETEIVPKISTTSPPLPKKPAVENSSIQKTSAPRVAAKTSPTSNLKVRVDLDRLERMNNLVGELVINRNSLILQHEQLRRIWRKVQQRLDQFQHLTGQFQKLSDQMIVNPINSQISPQQSTSIIKSEASKLEYTQDLSNFDSLEMDRYSNMHSSIQGVVEEMMQLEEVVEDVALLTRQSEQTIKQQQETLTGLRDELMWARMLPLETVLNQFPRGLRDLSLKYNKPVNLKMRGTEVLVDKGILEKLYDPLLHLIRNAFDHGIESPEVRLAQGKPEAGNIEIRAAHRGNRTVIEIRDDGAGLNLDKIAQRAIDRGWLSVSQLAGSNKEQLLDFIFEPGFSTRDQVSELSGRGVGLDVVRAQLQSVKGTVKVTSTPGEGTTFTLSLPLTLTVAKLLICSVDTTLVALPAASVEEVVFPKAKQTKQLGEQKVLSWRDELLPVYRLTDLLEYRYPISIKPKNQTFPTVESPEPGRLKMLIINGDKEDFALEVEDCSTEQELVIKPLSGAIANPNYIYGCSVLGDGSLIPVIDTSALLTYVQEEKQAKSNNQNNLTSSATPTNQNLLTSKTNTIRVPTILVVDDSAMMRRTLTLTLQKVGYRVLQARDGWEGIELLQQNSSIQLIVSDLEMPNLNGFEFLNQLRQSSEFSKIPVVMLTSRSNDKHRQLAMQLGAHAYLSKPYIEQEFLSVLKTIMGQEENKNSLNYTHVA